VSLSFFILSRERERVADCVGIESYPKAYAMIAEKSKL